MSFCFTKLVLNDNKNDEVSQVTFNAFEVPVLSQSMFIEDDDEMPPFTSYFLKSI